MPKFLPALQFSANKVNSTDFEDNQIEELKYEVETTQKISDRNLNNYKASLDTIRVEKNENNNLVSKIRSFEFDIKDLTKNNEKLVNDYKKALNVNNEIE